MFDNKFLPIDTWVYNKLLSICTFAKLTNIDLDIDTYGQSDCISLENDKLCITIMINHKLAISAEIFEISQGYATGIRMDRQIAYFNPTRKYQKLFDKLQPYLIKL